MQVPIDGEARLTDVVDVSVVIVSYNVREMLLRCLASVDVALAGRPHDIVVIDNASTDGSASAVRDVFPRVRLVESPVNCGFGAANNQGIERTRGEFVLLINPDAEIEPSAVRKLLAVLESQPNVGIVGPRLRYPDGSVQSSRRRFPTPLTAIVESTIIQGWLPHNRLLDRYYVADRPDRTQDVDWLVGACLLVRRSVLHVIGGFDERFFMYSEELDLCRRARGAGWRIVYVSDADVTHHEGASSEKNIERRSQTFFESKARYFEKYHGESAARALRIVLIASTALDLLAESSKLLVGHRPELRRARLATLSRIGLDQLSRLGGYQQSSDNSECPAASRPPRYFRDPPLT